MLRLAEVDARRLAELVTDAWRMRAPDDLVGDLDATRGNGRGKAARGRAGRVRRVSPPGRTTG